MFDWICHNRDVFLMNYVEIGHSYQLAKELQEEHNHFTMSSMVNKKRKIVITFIHSVSEIPRISV